MSVKYKIHNPNGMYFLTYATVNWVDVFTREMYSDIIVESLRHCQTKKGLVLHGWCIMTNHVHLIASASQNPETFVPLENIMRDHKKFAGAEIISK